LAIAESDAIATMPDNISFEQAAASTEGSHYALVDIRAAAVCNTKNTGLVKSLGADVVIDYQTQNFTKTETKLDFIFDAVGKALLGSASLCLPKKEFTFQLN
jgi:hypothetical protein